MVKTRAKTKMPAKTKGKSMNNMLKPKENKHFFMEYCEFILKSAKDKQSIYMACETLYATAHSDQNDYLPLILPYFFIALTRDLNTLEKIKINWISSTDKVADEIVDFETTLSQRYIFLMKMFANNYCIQRECALTAFSLNPSEQNYFSLLNFADKTWPTANKDGNSDKIRSKTMSLYGINGAVLCNSTDYDTLEMPFSDVNDFSSFHNLYGDLMAVIMAPRNKQLTWLVNDWSQFSEKCHLFLEDCDYKRKFVARNLCGQWKLAKFNQTILLEKVKMRTINDLKKLKEKNDSLVLDDKLFQSKKLLRKSSKLV